MAGTSGNSVNGSYRVHADQAGPGPWFRPREFRSHYLVCTPVLESLVEMGVLMGISLAPESSFVRRGGIGQFGLPSDTIGKETQ